MKDTVTIKELIAIVLRNGRFVVAMALVVAIVLGAIATYSGFSEMRSFDELKAQREEAYQLSLQEYKDRLAKLENEQKYLETYLAADIEYCEKSWLVDIDPCNKAVTQVVLVVNDLNENGFSDVYVNEGVSSDLVTSKIANQYYAIWQVVDLQNALNYDLEDKYLREVIYVQLSEDSTLRITTIATTKEKAEELSLRMCDLFAEYQEQITSSSYPHVLSVLSLDTKIVSDSTEPPIWKAVEARITNNRARIVQIEAERSVLIEPVREVGITIADIVKDAVKDVVVGFVLGIVIAVVWVLVSWLFSNKLLPCGYTSGIPLSISVAVQKNAWDRMASRIQGERVWETQEQALNYLSSWMPFLFTNTQKIAVMTTLDEKTITQMGLKVFDLIKAQENQVEIVYDAYNNTQAMQVVSKCDVIVLVECLSVSQINRIDAVASQVGIQEKRIKGFIVC